MELKDKVVLITGSSDGIGAETAKNFAKEGANVVVTYNSNKDKGNEVFEECNKLKEAMLIKLDVTNENSVEESVEKIIDKFGAIDILVNNAGVISWKEFSEQNVKEIESQVEVNLEGLLRVTKKVLPFLKAQGEGIIINIGSGAGKHAFAGLSVYSGTKFAVRGFSQALAKELPEGIKVYVVNPGMTATKMTNYQGVEPKKVSEVIVKTAKENLGKTSGDDIDVSEYV